MSSGKVTGKGRAGEMSLPHKISKNILLPRQEPTGINIKNSKVSKVSDRENIFDAVKSSVGFDALNH